MQYIGNNILVHASAFCTK